MADRALLVLEDGSVYEGVPFGGAAQSNGEVVFSTAMTGYQEMLTDPSFAGQVLVLTYPLAGNYGITHGDVESKRIQVRGLVVHEACDRPSHWNNEMTLHEYLVSENIPGIAGVDTRAITRKLRAGGVLMGTITTEETADEALARLRSAPRYGETDLVHDVSTHEPYEWDATGQRHVVVVDVGVKYNILRMLAKRGCRVTTMPADSTAEAILAAKPDGVLFSPGPGDPMFLDEQVGTLKSLIGKTPVLGICLGHQVFGRAFGAKTFKLKFGHRGANHPVQDVATGRVHITAQNHGYAVDPDGLSSDVEVWQTHLNDGTCEGLRHTREPVLSIQYHSEASPGPLDNMYVFDEFVGMIEAFGK